MRIASKEFVIKKMTELMISPKKKYSQNFLVNLDVVKDIVDNLKEENIIEIGPGLGALSEEILLRDKNLLAYEIDEEMCKHLEAYFSFYKKFQLIKGDFLKNKFTLDGEYDVVSNLPYSLTTPIIEKVLLSDNHLHNFVFMVQKEVYSRLKGTDKKDYSPLTILIDYLGGLKIVTKVTKDQFIPSPNVDSIVLKIEFNENFLSKSKKEFYKFLNACFAMRRKTILNNLIGYFKDKEKALLLLNKTGLKENTRPEQISLEEYLKIFNESLLIK